MSLAYIFQVSLTKFSSGLTVGMKEKGMSKTMPVPGILNVEIRNLLEEKTKNFILNHLSLEYF